MTKEKLSRYSAAIGLLIAAIAYYPRFIKDPTGVTLYPQAAECLLHHQALPACALPFTYPPAFAFVMIPFVPLPLWARDLAWYLVTWASLVVAWWGSERLAWQLCPGAWSEAELATWRVCTAILSLKFILAVFENQAYDLLAFAFIVLGLVALAQARASLGAIGLAFAAAIKATPLIFLPWLVLKRRAVAVVVFAGALAIFSLLSDLLFYPSDAPHGHLVTWLRNIAGASLRNEASPNQFAFWSGSNLLNHSLRGAAARLIDEHAQPALFKGVVYSASAVFALIVGGLLFKAARRRDCTGVEGSLLVIAMLILSPMTSRSHLVVLMLPFMMLTALAVKVREHRVLYGTILLVAFVLTTATSNDLVGQRMTEWAYFYSLMPLGSIVLVVGLAICLLLERPLEPRVRSEASLAHAPHE